MARLWLVVLLANLAGALAVALVLGHTDALEADLRRAFTEIGRESLKLSLGVELLRGIFAGWLIAMLIWVLPFAEMSRFFVIVALTWIIGICSFTHVIPALIGNILGGVPLVAALNHAQVVS